MANVALYTKPARAARYDSRMAETTGLRIDLARLDANLAALRGVTQDARCCAVVKADCYGLGAEPIARRLVERGVDMLAVYSLAQARQMIEAGIDAPLLTLGVVDDIAEDDSAAAALRAGRLHVTIHSPEQLQRLIATARRLGATGVPVHLHLDTGMSRGGLSEREFAAVCAGAADLAPARIAGVSTHMASGDDDPDFTAEQLARFDRVLRDCRTTLGDDVMIHIANTAATLRARDYHRDMIRVGLGLYGYGPELLTPRVDDAPALLPIARWWTRLHHVARFPQGAAVGYNRTHILKRNSLLGVVPVGYADGYSLTLGNKATMDLPAHGAAAPIVGKVNMDQIVIDLTDIPDAKVGDEVILYSDDPASKCAVPNLAQLAGSNCYEMLTRINPRIAREYAD